MNDSSFRLIILVISSTMYQSADFFCNTAYTVANLSSFFSYLSSSRLLLLTWKSLMTATMILSTLTILVNDRWRWWCCLTGNIELYFVFFIFFLLTSLRNSKKWWFFWHSDRCHDERLSSIRKEKKKRSQSFFFFWAISYNFLLGESVRWNYRKKRMQLSLILL